MATKQKQGPPNDHGYIVEVEDNGHGMTHDEAIDFYLNVGRDRRSEDGGKYALSREKHLQRLLPICCYCKKIRDDSNYWHQVESYVSRFANVNFSHSVCPECTGKFRKDMGLE